MPSKDELKSEVCQAIDRRGEEIIGVAQAILESPEAGFREGKRSTRARTRNHPRMR